MTTPASAAAQPPSSGCPPGRRRVQRCVRPACPSKGPDVVVVVRDAEGQLKDLSWIPDVDVEVEPVAANTEDGRSVIRHSAAHVLAQAVQQEFPEAKLGIGPPIKDGFYYDFRVDQPVHPRGPGQAREADEEDHQGRAAVLAPRRRVDRGRARRAGERAVQARTDQTTSPGSTIRRSWRSAATS